MAHLSIARRPYAAEAFTGETLHGRPGPRLDPRFPRAGRPCHGQRDRIFMCLSVHRTCETVAPCLCGQIGTSVLQLQAELYRSWLIALRGYLSELSGAPVGIRIAKLDAVGYVAALRLKPHSDSLGYTRELEETDVLDKVFEASDARIPAGSITELQKAWVRPPTLCQIAVPVWIEVSVLQVCRARGIVHSIWTLRAVKQQVGEIVVHRDRKRPSAFVPQDTVQSPTLGESANNSTRGLGKGQLIRP